MYLKEEQTGWKQSVYKMQKQLFNMPRVKRQKMLGFFDSTKTIRLRRIRVNVEIPDEVEDDSKTAPCDICQKRLSNTHGLGMHKLTCKKKCSDSSKSSSTITSATWANHARKISSKISSAKHLGRSVSVATELNPAEPNPPKTKATRRSNIQKSYITGFQAKVIHEMQPGITQDDLANRYSISESVNSNWLKNKENVIAVAAENNWKLIKKQRKLAKYLELYHHLFEDMKAVCAKGRKVNVNWLWDRARTIQRKLTGEEPVAIWKDVITSFFESEKCSNACQTTKQKQTQGSLLGWLDEMA